MIFDADSEIEDDASEDEDNVQQNSESDDSDVEQDEEIAFPVPPNQTFMSKNGEIKWSSSPNTRQAKLSAENIMKSVPGPTRMQCLAQARKLSAFI